MTESQASPLLTARIIAFSLAIGVVIFWVVTWVVTEGGTEGIAAGALDPQLALWIWAAVAIPGFIGALVFRGKAVEASPAGGPGRRSPAGAARESGHGAADSATGRVQQYLIIAWALLEGPALLSGIFFMLVASIQLLVAAVLLYLVGVLMTLPRAEWFEAGAG